MKVNINTPKMNIGFGGERIETYIRQVEMSDYRPTNPNNLIWIDTGTNGIEFFTFDNELFITSDNKQFTVAPQIGDSVVEEIPIIENI